MVRALKESKQENIKEDISALRRLEERNHQDLKNFEEESFQTIQRLEMKNQQILNVLMSVGIILMVILALWAFFYLIERDRAPVPSPIIKPERTVIFPLGNVNMPNATPTPVPIVVPPPPTGPVPEPLPIYPEKVGTTGA